MLDNTNESRPYVHMTPVQTNGTDHSDSRFVITIPNVLFSELTLPSDFYSIIM